MLVVLIGQAVAAQPLVSPNPLDADGSGTVDIAYFSYASEIEDDILAADRAAENILRRATDSDSVEVFVLIVESWERAGLVNAGLIADVKLRDHLANEVGNDQMTTLQKVQSAYASYDWALFVVTELEGQPIPQDCLVQSVLRTVYQAAAQPLSEMVECIEASR